ncbi:MAG: NAD-dependent deacetylase [Actinobacteria bacterium]|jgi:NAD-dependent deacetylase|nr:NAD-dependent deacetylase [Actinomycetota bacterium]
MTGVRQGGDFDGVGNENERAIRKAHDILERSDRIVVLTGAGISTDSGVPDFRGPDGVWTKNPDAEKLSDIRYYLADAGIRRRVWQERLHSPVWNALPNDGHKALVSLEAHGKLHTLITQNIDGLHQLAGNDPSRIVEIHGTMREAVCMSCGARYDMQEVLERVDHGDLDPYCVTTVDGGQCGGIIDAATISFGQDLVEEDLHRADKAAREAGVLLAVGTSLAVFPAAGLVPAARASGASVIIVNGSPTEMDDLADVVIMGSISDILPRLVDAS